MLISVGVRKGIQKNKCDDVAIVGNQLIRDDYYEEEVAMPFVGVADGVGGTAGGDKASKFVLEHVSQLAFDTSLEEVKNQVKECNMQLIDYAMHNSGEEQMATTMTAISIKKNACILLHVGNTRLYAAQGKYLKQITQDHTTYQLLLNRNDIEAANNCNKDEIYSCFGGGKKDLLSAIDIREIFENGMPKLLVFTSDGIHGFIDIDEMESIIFSGQSQKDIVCGLIEKAIQNGSRDDLSVMILRL